MAIELYATIFEQLGALDKLEAFASYYGADFYKLPRNTGKIQLARTEIQVPDKLEFIGTDGIVPLGAGKSLPWKLVD